jgi:hypothetical protein
MDGGIEQDGDSDSLTSPSRLIQAVSGWHVVGPTGRTNLLHLEDAAFAAYYDQKHYATPVNESMLQVDECFSQFRGQLSAGRLREG